MRCFIKKNMSYRGDSSVVVIKNVFVDNINKNKRLYVEVISRPINGGGMYIQQILSAAIYFIHNQAFIKIYILLSCIITLLVI